MSSDPTSLFSEAKTDPGLPVVDPAPQPPQAAPALPPPPPAWTAPAAPVRLAKSPGLATFLSLFPGVGQIYNGQPAKAFAFFFGLIGAAWAAGEIHPLPFAPLIPFLYFFNLVDAYRSAHAVNAGGEAAAMLEQEAFESPAWGVGLIALGVLLLLNNLGWLDVHFVRRFWPVALIALGAWFIRASLQRRAS